MTASGAAVGLDFGSENTSPVHPAFVEAIVAANSGFATNFEAEAWTDEALVRLREFFEHRSLEAFTVSTGTAANAIALGAMVPPYGAILCHWDAHIETDECGAPEMFSFGARQIPLAGEHGRLSPQVVSTYLERARFGVVHALQPAALSLTNLTEAGTAYHPGQIEQLTRLVRPLGLGVHMDGARFANAAAAVGASPAELTWKSGVDILTLGTTKSGSFGVETIVSFEPRFNTPLSFLRKRSGHFAPKTRFLAAQLQAYMDGELWLKNARHANAAAGRLADGLAALPGVEFVHPVEGNEIFIKLPVSVTDALVHAGCRFQRDWRPEPAHHRFVCSWATSDASVDRVLEIAREAVSGRALQASLPELPSVARISI
jgi:threonine aldolase